MKEACEGEKIVPYEKEIERSNGDQQFLSQLSSDVQNYTHRVIKKGTTANYKVSLNVSWRFVWIA